MLETPKAYSRRQLISVAEVASTLAESRNIAGLEAVQQLAEAVRVGMLCPDLYPPHQQWQHGGDSERIGKPSGNSSGIWHSLAVASAKRHMSDKDDFNYPPAASTWHVLADDVMKFSGHHSIPSRVCAALQKLAARYKPELTAPPLKAEANRFLAEDSGDAPSQPQAAQQDAPGSNGNSDAQNAAAGAIPMKKEALIGCLEKEWPSIRSDFQDASRNGLKEVAHAGKHGQWHEAKVREWGISKGKLKKVEPQDPLSGAWSGPSRMHRI